MLNPKEELFKEIVQIIDIYANLAESAVRNPNEPHQWSMYQQELKDVATILNANQKNGEFRCVVEDVLIGFVHDFLVALDGATSLSDRVKISLVDEEGNSLGAGLHEWFFEYLSRINRLPPPK